MATTGKYRSNNRVHCRYADTVFPDTNNQSYVEFHCQIHQLKEVQTQKFSVCDRKLPGKSPSN